MKYNVNILKHLPQQLAVCKAAFIKLDISHLDNIVDSSRAEIFQTPHRPSPLQTLARQITSDESCDSCNCNSAHSLPFILLIHAARREQERTGVNRPARRPLPFWCRK